MNSPKNMNLIFILDYINYIQLLIIEELNDNDKKKVIKYKKELDTNKNA